MNLNSLQINSKKNVPYCCDFSENNYHAVDVTLIKARKLI